MADPSRYPGSKPDAARRWVKIAVLIGIIAALLFAVLHLVGGGGGHGPARHFRPAQSGGTAP